MFDTHVKFSKGAGDNILSFPLTQDAIDNLEPCGLHSPLVGEDPFPQFDHWADEDSREQTIADFLKARADVNRGVFPYWLMHKYYPWQGKFSEHTPQPLVNQGLSYDNPQALAHIVHMDKPTDMPFAVLDWVHSLGHRPKQARENCVDFLEYIESLDKLSQAVYRNLRKAFSTKYYRGTPRPEEVLGYNCTAYKEGCPPHGSDPAGHGAAAGSVSVIISRYDLPDDVVAVIRDTAYAWSMFRTFAGVHWPQDNVNGLRCSGLL